jgi:uncharacterized membrane protein YqgA involved in biofilm formation
LNQEKYREVGSMGTIINALAIVIGGALGLLFRKGFPERISQTILQVLGLFTLVVGLGMAIQGQELIMVLISLALGAALGEWLDIEGRLDRFGSWLEKRQLPFFVKKFHEEWMSAEVRTRAMLKGVKLFLILVGSGRNTSRRQ